MSRKQKSTTTPAKAYKPYIDSGAQAYQSTFQQQQPVGGYVQDRLGSAFESFASKVGKPDPFTERMRTAMSETGGGAFLGRNPGAAAYGAIGSRAFGNPAFGLLEGYAREDSAPTDSFYSDTLSGKYLDQGNPYLDGMIGSTLDDVASRVNARFAASGVGFGHSTAHEGILARELARAANDMRGRIYESERDRQMAAASGWDSSYNARRDRGLSAADAYGDLYGDASRTALAAAQADDEAWNAERNRMLEAGRSAPAFAEADYAGIPGLLSLAEGTLNAPWMATNNYGDGIGGLLGNYTKTKGKSYGLGNAIDVYGDYNAKLIRAANGG